MDLVASSKGGDFPIALPSSLPLQQLKTSNLHVFSELCNCLLQITYHSP